MKKILAIGAHPDDIELGCAGTLRRFQQLNDAEIDIVYTLSPYHDVADIEVGKEQLVSYNSRFSKSPYFLSKFDGLQGSLPNNRSIRTPSFLALVKSYKCNLEI